MLLLGIIKQLMTTRQTRLFRDVELNLSQFGVLNHFTHTPERRRTVTELADVMEMNQPGITKVVSVLVDKGFLDSQADAADKRKRYLKITPRGIELCMSTFESLLPDISYVFESWNNAELDQLHEHMEKLMHWLDEHRDDLKLS